MAVPSTAEDLTARNTGNRERADIRDSFHHMQTKMLCVQPGRARFTAAKLHPVAHGDATNTGRLAFFDLAVVVGATGGAAVADLGHHGQWMT